MNIMRAPRLCLLSLALAFATCFATISAGDSSPAYNFLNITSSARIFGLGGINITTVSDDVTTIDQNPALLGPEFDRQVAVNYMRYIGSSNFAGVRYAGRASDRSAWSAAINYFGYGSIKESDIEGNVTGDFSPKDLNFSAAYSHDLGARWRGGFNIKFLYSSYGEYSAFALATDLGVNYYDDERDLSLSVVAANLGGQIKRFDTTYDRLPMDLRVGWAQSFGSFPVRFSATLWNLTQWTGENNGNLFSHIVFAADLIPSEKFNIGIGYNYKTRADMSGDSRSFLSGFSIGAGLNIKACSIGVAFAQPHPGATSLMFNIALNINNL